MISGESIFSILPPPCRGRAGVGVDAVDIHDSTPILTFPLQEGRNSCGGSE